FVIAVLISIEPGHRFVQLRTIRVVHDPAFQKVFSELKILSLSLNAECESGLGRIIHRGGACVPSHVPRRHVPKQNRAWLQGRDLPEKKKNPAPFRSFPGNVRLNEKSIRDEGTETAQRRNKAQLTDLLAKSQIESDRANMQAA